MPAYSRILLPWDSQPQEVVELSSEVPVGSLVYVPGHPLFGGSLGGEIGTPVTITDGAAAVGKTIEASASSSRLPIGALQRAQANVGMTWVSRHVLTSTSTRYVTGTVSTGTNYIEDIALNSDSAGNASSGIAFCSIRQQGGVTANRSRAVSTNAVLTQGVPQTVVWQWSGAGAFALWVDGVSCPATIETSAYTTSSAAAMEFPLVLLNRNDRNAFALGGTGLQLGLFARIPSGWVDGKSISADPWGTLFAPRSIWVPVSAAAGGTTISGALGTATASGSTATVNANRTIAGALGEATATGFQGTVSNSTDTTITGNLGTATASGLQGIVNANRTIAGALGDAAASGLQGTVSNTADVVIYGALGAAVATGFSGGVNANTTIFGVLGVAVAEGLSGGVQNGAPQIGGGGGWLPMPRKRSKKEIDDERRKLGILPPEVVEAAAAIPKPQREKITMAQLVGKTKAKEVSRFDLEAAITAHKKKRQRQEDELLLLM